MEADAGAARKILRSNTFHSVHLHGSIAASVRPWLSNRALAGSIVFYSSPEGAGARDIHSINAY